MYLYTYHIMHMYVCVVYHTEYVGVVARYFETAYIWMNKYV